MLMPNSSDTIRFACGGCGRPFTVPAAYAGRRAVCKNCGAKVEVPSAAPAIAAAGSAIRAGAGALAGSIDHTHARVIGEDSGRAPEARAAAMQASGAAPKSLATDAAAPKAHASKVPVRVRRLMADAQQMAQAFGAPDGPIRIKSAVGDPPELYQLEYHVRGLQRGWFGRPKKRDVHRVEIQLTSEYPRVSPMCRMLTPVFHPNMDETTICVGDHWTAGERLIDLAVRIGEMLAYQAYNIKSPLNGEAAMWADLHANRLPTDSRNLHAGEEAIA